MNNSNSPNISIKSIAILAFVTVVLIFSAVAIKSQFQIGHAQTNSSLPNQTLNVNSSSNSGSGTNVSNFSASIRSTGVSEFEEPLTLSPTDIGSIAKPMPEPQIPNEDAISKAQKEAESPKPSGVSPSSLNQES